LIRLEVDGNGNINVVHNDESPSVYLDHWAWRRIAGNQDWASRFVAALKARHGTLTLSWVNLVEYSKVTSDEQAHQAESLLEACMPRAFFIDPQPFEVIRREDEILAGGPRRPPHGDEAITREFVVMGREDVNPLSAPNLFKMVRSEGMVSSFERLAETIAGRLEAIRKDFDVDAAFRAAVRRLPSGPRLSQGTRFVVPELIGTILRDSGMKITRNHAIDFLHAAVPVSYCDLVLLDRHWTAQVEKVRARLTSAGIDVPVARVFSEGSNGVERFLRALQSGEG
jgi:hypothetical protein